MRPVLYLLASFLLAIPVTTTAQKLVGSWQLVKQTTCMDNEVVDGDSSVTALRASMKSLASPTASVVKFKMNGSGEESTRILTRKKKDNQNQFLYKLSNETLLILDKKSQTLTETFVIEKLSVDSLILSNSSRPCETRIFLKIKE